MANRLSGAPRPLLYNDVKRDRSDPHAKEPLQFCRAHSSEPSSCTPFAASDGEHTRLGECSGMTPER